MQRRHARSSVAALGLMAVLAAGAVWVTQPAAGGEFGIRTIPLKGRYTALSLGRDGASAVVVDERRGAAAIVDTEARSVARPDLSVARVLVAVPLPQSRGHVVVGTSRKGEATVHVLDPLAGGAPISSRGFDLPARVDGATIAEGLALYLRSPDWPVIMRIQLCLIEELNLAACRERRSEDGSYGGGAEVFHMSGTPVAHLVADAASNLVVAVQRGLPEVVGLDSRYGKLQFAQSFPELEPPLRLAGSIGDGATLFVSSRQSGAVEILEIDRDFRELSPAGRIDLGALRGSAALTISIDDVAQSEGSGPDRDAWHRLAGKVAAGARQPGLLIAGLEPGTLHLLERRGTSNRLVLDIRAEKGEIRDFAMSPDGSHLGILLDGMLIVSPVRTELLALAERADVEASVEVGEVERAIARSLQTRLSEEGFYRGVVDGLWGPQSEAALDRFRTRNSIATASISRPAEVDAATLGSLFADDLESFPVDAFGPERAQAVREAAFASFFARNLPRVQHFAAREIFTTGRGGAAAKCGGLNALPGEALWPAILPAVRRLDELRAELGQSIRVLSSYQTTEYASCAGTPGALVPEHGAFAAIEFAVDRLSATPETAERLARLVGGPGGVTLRAGAEGFHLAVPAGAQPRERLGAWHAIIASYRPGTRGCAEALADVEEFAELLDDTGLGGAQIYVARTTISDHYAVTVDAGEDRRRAVQAVSVIRRVASRSADGRTGADSFLQTNKGWQIDERCRSVRVLD